MKQAMILLLFSTAVMGSLSFTTDDQRPHTERTGKELFERHCKQCHGKDGTRGLFGAKNLQTSQLSDDNLYMAIAKGRKVMPAWEKRLDTNQLHLVADYVKTLRKQL